MIGKIVKIAVIGLLAATLIGGSAYVVLRPNEAQAQQENGGRGQSGREYVSEAGGGKGYGAENTPGQGTGNGNGKGNSAATVPGKGNGQGGGQGAGGGKGNSGEPKGSGEGYPATEWVTVNGEVIARVDDELIIRTADGEMVVHLGPEWYWDAEGITLSTGDQVQVTGFYEGDEFEVAGVEDTTTGESVTLRDDSGRPMWAGRGRRGS
jgi:uncharacterized protein YdeI (BOF family)